MVGHTCEVEPSQPLLPRPRTKRAHQPHHTQQSCHTASTEWEECGTCKAELTPPLPQSCTHIITCSGGLKSTGGACLLAGTAPARQSQTSPAWDWIHLVPSASSHARIPWLPQPSPGALRYGERYDVPSGGDQDQEGKGSACEECAGKMGVRLQLGVHGCVRPWQEQRQRAALCLSMHRCWMPIADGFYDAI